MKLTVRMSDITLSEPVVLLSRDDCLELGVNHNDRIRISGDRSIVSSLVMSDKVVSKGIISMPSTIMNRCGAIDGG